MARVKEGKKDLGASLLRARERSGFSQDDVAVLTGQPRPVVSNWENGQRVPNDRQLEKLAAIYRVDLSELLRAEPKPRPQFEQLLFRNAGTHLDVAGKFQVQQFLGFLEKYSSLLELLDEPSGMASSPFVLREGFVHKDDIRRKADEVRTRFALGAGPIGNLESFADFLGIALYKAPLGANLKTTVSGAFFPHHRVGFAVLINAQTTPGHRQFTIAHELAHAFFHGDKPYVDYFGRSEERERFANAFAAEFLVPINSLRAVVEVLGVKRIDDAETVIYLQRLFGVSYAMTLVRLRAASLLSSETEKALRGVHPVRLAEKLGYTTHSDESGQTPDQWSLGRFPPRSLRLMKQAIESGRVSRTAAASLIGMPVEAIEELLTPAPAPPLESEDEYEYLVSSAS